MTRRPASWLARAWMALWERARPLLHLGDAGFVVSAAPTTAALRAMADWRPDWKTEAIARILRSRPGLLVDVGANVGQTLLDYLTSDARHGYLGFEPNAACIQHLSRFIEQNRLDDCRVVQCALGDRNGVTPLFSYGGQVDSGATTTARLRPRLRDQETVVAILRFDDVAPLLVDGPVSLVKVDVEGGELAVLEGMREALRAVRPWLLCEVLQRDVSADPNGHAQRNRALMNLLRELEYAAFRIDQDQSGTTLRGLASVSHFPEEVWDDRTSPFCCDYLFVPVEERDAAMRALRP